MTHSNPMPGDDQARAEDKELCQILMMLGPKDLRAVAARAEEMARPPESSRNASTLCELAAELRKRADNIEGWVKAMGFLPGEDLA